MKLIVAVFVLLFAVAVQAQQTDFSKVQIKSEGLPAEWKPWGTGFIKTDMWLELIYRSLTKK